MAKVGRAVRVSVCAAGPPQPHAQVIDVEGVLTAGRDPAVVAANGFEDAAIFGVGDLDGFSLYLVNEDFQDARLDGDRLIVRTGGVAVVIGPPLLP